MAYTRKEQIGDCTLYQGDCMDILPTLGKVDAVVTDPPYGIGFKYENYDDKEEAYLEFMLGVVEACRGAVNEGSPLFFWQAMRHCSRFHEWFPPNFRIFAAIKNFTQYLPTPLQFSWDPVVWWTEGKSSRKVIAVDRDYHIGNTARWVAEDRNGHPCPRPLDTVEYVVRVSTKTENCILDPFMGSGTTGVACVKLGRKFIGIEIEPRYFDIACKRIEDAHRQGDLFVPKPASAVQESLL